MTLRARWFAAADAVATSGRIAVDRCTPPLPPFALPLLPSLSLQLWIGAPENAAARTTWHGGCRWRVATNLMGRPIVAYGTVAVSASFRVLQRRFCADRAGLLPQLRQARDFESIVCCKVNFFWTSCLLHIAGEGLADAQYGGHRTLRMEVCRYREVILCVY